MENRFPKFFHVDNRVTFLEDNYVTLRGEIADVNISDCIWERKECLLKTTTTKKHHQKRQPCLPTSFYSVLVSVSVFITLSTVFHCINSPVNSSFSHSVLPVLALPYWSFQLHISVWKVSFSHERIPCGWLGSKHQFYQPPATLLPAKSTTKWRRLLAYGITKRSIG